MSDILKELEKTAETARIAERKELEFYYEKPRKQYWYRADSADWIPCGKEVILDELEIKGWKARPERGKRCSEADIKVSEVRSSSNIEFAGSVAGHLAGIKTYKGERILITKGPNLIDPVEGDWENIKKLGGRLFPDGQFEYVLGWSQNALRGLYRGGCNPGQMLVMAGPSGVGKTFWQSRIITPMLGDRMAKPIQFMTGGTTFNSDIISCEHLMLSDEISKTDMKSRNAFGTAVKNFTVNPDQRIHGKGTDGFVVDSCHWLTMSINDTDADLEILPPLSHGIKDKLILLKCGEGINDEWPGGHSERAELQKCIGEQLPAFIYYLINNHVVKDSDSRYGVASYKHPVIVDQINGSSSGAHLEFLIDMCWSKLAEEGGKLKAKSEIIKLELSQHPVVGRTATDLLRYRHACGRLLSELHEINPDKYIPPSKHSRKEDAVWTIDWSKS